MGRTMIKEPVIEMRCDIPGCTKSITSNKGMTDIPNNWVAFIGTYTDHEATIQFTLIICPEHGFEICDLIGMTPPATQKRIGTLIAP